MRILALDTSTELVQRRRSATARRWHERARARRAAHSERCCRWSRGCSREAGVALARPRRHRLRRRARLVHRHCASPAASRRDSRSAPACRVVRRSHARGARAGGASRARLRRASSPPRRADARGLRRRLRARRRRAGTSAIGARRGRAGDAAPLPAGTAAGSAPATASPPIRRCATRLAGALAPCDADARARRARDRRARAAAPRRRRRRRRARRRAALRAPPRRADDAPSAPPGATL